jgi:DNA-binding XRE family transcriptional regulator
MPEGGFIYALRAVGTPYVKIGSAKDVEVRRKQLQTGQPWALEIVATIFVGAEYRSIEYQIHTMLAAHQQSGEWFDVPMDAARLAALVQQARQPDTIGAKIKRLRQGRGLSQRQLAGAARVPQPLISQIESGKRPGAHIHLAVAARLAFALQVSLDTLASDLSAA